MVEAQDPSMEVITVSGLKYYRKRDIAKGTFSSVFLYENEAKNNKIALKIA